jgi:hypothetical protein
MASSTPNTTDLESITFDDGPTWTAVHHLIQHSPLAERTLVVTRDGMLGTEVHEVHTTTALSLWRSTETLLWFALRSLAYSHDDVNLRATCKAAAAEGCGAQFLTALMPLLLTAPLRVDA